MLCEGHTGSCFFFRFFLPCRRLTSQVAHFAIDCHLIKSRKHILALRRISFAPRS